MIAGHSAFADTHGADGREFHPSLAISSFRTTYSPIMYVGTTWHEKSL